VLHTVETASLLLAVVIHLFTVHCHTSGMAVPWFYMILIAYLSFYLYIIHICIFSYICIYIILTAYLFLCFLIVKKVKLLSLCLTN
jgi:hypothetical protein